MAEAVHMFKNY